VDVLIQSELDELPRVRDPKALAQDQRPGALTNRAGPNGFGSIAALVRLVER
jgi:hypothetical protein